MAKPNDKVQAVVQESTAKGGDSADIDPFYASYPLIETEDALTATGLFLQPQGGPVDENVCIWREGSVIKVVDPVFGERGLLSAFPTVGWARDEAETTTGGSVSFISKITVNFNVTGNGGLYLYLGQAEIGTEVANQNYSARVLADGVTNAETLKRHTVAAHYETWTPVGILSYGGDAVGAHTLELVWRVFNATHISGMRRARLIIWQAVEY